MSSADRNPATLASLTQDEVNGRVTGALFFIGFGAIWTLLGWGGLHRGMLVVTALLGMIVAALLAVSMWLFRIARGLPMGTWSPEQQDRAKRMFTAVNIIQWVSVVAAIGILGVLHHPAYIAPAIALIVGLHLLPLAQTFGYRQHYVTAVLLILWSLGCMAVVPQARVAAMCSLGVGTVLLCSAASTLLRCLSATRGSTLHKTTQVTAA